MTKFHKDTQSGLEFTRLFSLFTEHPSYILEILDYTDLGMELTKIHRVLQFNEYPWLAKYIDFNTNKRSNAKKKKKKKKKNAFEKDFFFLYLTTRTVIICANEIVFS